jgi:hypothetical protein
MFWSATPAVSMGSKKSDHGKQGEFSPAGVN